MDRHPRTSDSCLSTDGKYQPIETKMIHYPPEQNIGTLMVLTTLATMTEKKGIKLGREYGLLD